jgi:hypothetical protein
MTIAEINAALLTKLAACGDVVRTVTTVPAPIRDMVHRRLEDDARRLSTHLLPRTRAYHEIWLDGEPRREEESAADEPDSAHGDDPQQPEHLSAAAAPVAFIEAEQRLEGAAAVGAAALRPRRPQRPPPPQIRNRRAWRRMGPRAPPEYLGRQLEPCRQMPAVRVPDPLG